MKGKVMRFLNALLLLLSVMLANACAPLVYSDADPTVDFSSLATFTWASSPPLVKSGEYPISAQTEVNMTRAIQAAFEAKGYQFVSTGPADFAVSYSMGARDEIELQSYPAAYTSTFDQWTWGGSYYGYAYALPPSQVAIGTREVEVTRGTLSVDVYSVRERRPIWHAQASKSLTEAELNGSGSLDFLEDANAILADFPARGQ